MWSWSTCFRSDSCEAKPPSIFTTENLIPLTPFLLIFLFIATLSAKHLFPRLSNLDSTTSSLSGSSAEGGGLDGEEHYLPSHAPAALRQVHAEHGAKSWRVRAAAWTFGATIGGAGTLGSLMLSEILGVVGRQHREVALRVVEPVVLFLVVGLVPWLECRGVVSTAGWTFRKSAKGKRPRVAWGLNFVLFLGWVFAFWSVGRAIPEAATEGKDAEKNSSNKGFVDALLRGSLERVGVVGISLMALLAGFASASAPWHTFGDVMLFPSSSSSAAARRRKRPVTDADVSRKEGGWEATREMLATKRHRLAQLERKMADAQAARSGAAGGRGAGASMGVLGKVMGSLRGPSSEEVEVRALRVEIAGLETMETTLASSLAVLRANRQAAVLASTPWGRMMLLPSYLFSAYCVYRILATLLTTVRRASSPSASFSASDPINRFLSLLARHWDPTLDQVAWARTISFLLSGVILLASIKSVMQTFYLFAKLMPGLVKTARANFALAVGQVAATYVISAGLLLRSQLPREVGRQVMGRVLLSPAWVDGWFEGWFLLGTGVTLLGLWVGRKLGGGEEEWDDFGMEEMGAKRM